MRKYDYSFLRSENLVISETPFVVLELPFASLKKLFKDHKDLQNKLLCEINLQLIQILLQTCQEQLAKQMTELMPTQTMPEKTLKRHLGVKTSNVLYCNYILFDFDFFFVN